MLTVVVSPVWDGIVLDSVSRRCHQAPAISAVRRRLPMPGWWGSRSFQNRFCPGIWPGPLVLSNPSGIRVLQPGPQNTVVQSGLMFSQVAYEQVADGPTRDLVAVDQLIGDPLSAGAQLPQPGSEPDRRRSPARAVSGRAPGRCRATRIAPRSRRPAVPGHRRR
jgi:hypothetical protein